MRPPLAWLGCIAILALLTGPVRADEDSSAAAVLNQCAIATQRQAVKGMEELRARCPDLERALSSLGLTQQLGESWQKRIDSRALVGLAHLADRFTGAPPAAAPDPVALAAAMQSLQSHDTHPSLWERFKSWLRSWFRSPEERTADNSWLQQWLARIQLPPLLARVVGYLAIALLLGLSLWIVLRELRAADVLPRSPAQDRGAAHAGALAPAAAAPLDPTALESLPLWQQPAALLGMLVETLQRSGRLKFERALTHRELVERALLDESAQRLRLQRVAQLAERQLYGAPRVAGAGDETALRRALAEGLSLRQQLLAGAGGAR
ncbi:MAG: hypothetical protein WB646_02415 [Steroidobacteraceae bacterium]